MHAESKTRPDLVYDFAIAGAGLAGVLCAYELSKKYSVLFLDPRGIAGGTSGMASGLVNPMMSQKANPIWNCEACMDAFENTIHESDGEKYYSSGGVLRPAISLEQADYFKSKAELHPQLSGWFDSEGSQSQYPNVLSPFGSLFVKRGGSLDIKSWLKSLVQQSQERGLVMYEQALESWTRSEEGFECVIDGGVRVRCKKLLLCTGRWNDLLGKERAEILHSIKGQTIELSRPSDWPDTLAISGPSYVVTLEDRLIVGSTYDHSFENLEVDPVSTEELLTRASQINPSLGKEEVIEEWVGVRITKPGSRLPYFLELEIDVFSVGALGSKGILLGSYIAKNIGGWINGATKPPRELSW